MNERPRRIRNNEWIRNMTRETRVSTDSLILPFFVRYGKGVIEDIPSLQNQKRYSPDTIVRGVEEGLKAGIHSFILFGIPKYKDELGTEAFSDNGVIQQSIKSLKKEFGNDIYLITDVCLCEYTSHGHCGVVKNNCIDNDDTLPIISETALSHVLAGCDMVAPSDMMDNRIESIRATLDFHNFTNIPIMSYAAKYSSAFYGPFRAAADSTPQFGDRKSYQMDYHNSKEALKEALLDVEQGSDIIMVKPALSYLDIISKISEKVNVPVAAYSVSGEYSMIKAAAKLNLIDEYNTMCETTISIFRAGANILISYYSKEIAGAIKKGDIG